MANNPDTPSRHVLVEAARADLAQTIAAWTVRHWESLPRFQRASITFALNGGPFCDHDLLLAVPARWVLQALQSQRSALHERTN